MSAVHNPVVPAAASSATAAGQSSDLSAALVQGRIKRVRSSLFYKLTMLVVALVMSLLILIYLGMIGGAGYGLYLYGEQGFRNIYAMSAAEREHNMFGLAIMLAVPLLAGLLVIFFMIKPLLARPAKAIRPRALKPEEEPELFALVQRLCKVVGAPVPVRIQVDGQVNASAGPAGGLFSILLRQLNLTIGMPLAAGLSLRQLTGVLAHELGHFSQGGGMLFHYLIISTNNWFARVVYQRDAWDVWLYEASRGGDIRIRLIFYVTRLFVWLTRRVLWVLMHIGRFFSFFLSRQLEYDADRSETRVAGSRCFEETTHQIHLLGLAWEKTKSDLKDAFEEKRLGDDLPAMIAVNRDAIPEAMRAEFLERVMKASGGLFATHPAPRARVKSAARENAEGIFTDERPAAALFRHYGELCKAVTMDFYAATLGPAVARVQLTPTREIIGRQQKMVESFDAVEGYYLGCLDSDRPLALEPSDFGPPENPKAVALELQRARERFADIAAQGRSGYKLFNEALRMDVMAFVAGESVKAKLPFRPEGMKIRNSEETHAIHAKAQMLRDEAEMSLAPCEDALRGRLLAALRLLQTPQLAQRIPEAPQLLDQAGRLAEAVNGYRMILEPIAELRRQHAMLAFMLSHIKKGTSNQQLIDKLYSTARAISRVLTQIQGSMRLVRYPFSKDDVEITMGHYLMEHANDPRDVEGAMAKSQEVLERLGKFFYRAAGELAQIAERVEGVLGMKALPKPEKEEEAAEKED